MINLDLLKYNFASQSPISDQNEDFWDSNYEKRRPVKITISRSKLKQRSKLDIYINNVEHLSHEVWLLDDQTLENRSILVLKIFKVENRLSSEVWWNRKWGVVYNFSIFSKY